MTVSFGWDGVEMAWLMATLWGTVWFFGAETRIGIGLAAILFAAELGDMLNRAWDHPDDRGG